MKYKIVDTASVFPAPEWHTLDFSKHLMEGEEIENCRAYGNGPGYSFRPIFKICCDREKAEDDRGWFRKLINDEYGPVTLIKIQLEPKERINLQIETTKGRKIAYNYKASEKE